MISREKSDEYSNLLEEAFVNGNKLFELLDKLQRNTEGPSITLGVNSYEEALNGNSTGPVRYSATLSAKVAYAYKRVSGTGSSARMAILMALLKLSEVQFDIERTS